MTAYYNEIEPFAVAWLRQLIEAGHIAPGIVDDRSIEDVTPGDLAGFDQCHFFAGIGVWSYALRRAGWPDSRRVWTASCPCQPFSTAGQGVGFADERHLWPSLYHLITQCNPECVIGEQVASKDAGPWIDLVHTDMEALGYAFGAVPFPSASIGAPHIRDRLYWVADANHTRPQGWIGMPERGGECTVGAASVASWMEYTGYDDDAGEGRAASVGQPQADRPANITCGYGGAFVGMADSNGGQCDGLSVVRGPECNGPDTGRPQSVCEPVPCGDVRPTSPVNGFWRDADWLYCRDDKWRPVESGAFPLAHGAAARVGRLRGYGNAINAIQAQIFIEALILTGPGAI